jgi:hypothetical protein
MVVVAGVLLVLTFVSTEHFRAFGGVPDPGTLARMRASPHFVEGKSRTTNRPR